MSSFIILGDATGSSKRLNISRVVSYVCKQSEKTITLVSVISLWGGGPYIQERESMIRALCRSPAIWSLTVKKNIYQLS